jgi:hypothetical protein
MFQICSAAPRRFRRHSGKAALIAVAVLVAALFVAGGIYYINRPKEPPKVADTPVVSADEIKKQAAGEAGLGVKGNPGQPGAPVQLMPDGRPLPQ